MKLKQSLPKMSKLKVLKTWYGEADIATLVNHAGFWVSKDGIEHDESRIFDNDPETIWHSDPDFESKVKIIGVEFKVISFGIRYMPRIIYGFHIMCDPSPHFRFI